MLGWLLLGIALLVRDIYWLWHDRENLQEVQKIATRPGGRAARHQALRDWAEGHPRSQLAGWLRLVWQSGEHGTRLDAAALTATIKHHSGNRHYGFNYVSRSAILLGLAFTSYGLCTTLLQIAPALRASGLAYEAWVAGVQLAMAQALGGMATAFSTSLAGVGITLLLTCCGMFLTKYHRRYLDEADTFIQSHVIPIFAAQTSQSETSALAGAVREVQKVLTTISEQYGELRKQLEETERIREDMEDMRRGLRTSVSQFCEGLTAFGQHVATFEAGARTVEETGTGLRTALMEGLGHVARSQEEGFEVIRQAQADGIARLELYRTEVIEPFRADVVDGSSRLRQQTETMLAHIRQLCDQAQAAHHAIGRVSETLDTTVADIGQRLTDVSREQLLRQQQSITDLARTTQDRVTQVTNLLDRVLRS
jgi:hypothetical protein